MKAAFRGRPFTICAAILPRQCIQKRKISSVMQWDLRPPICGEPNNMAHLSQPCTRCNRLAVNPPTKADLDKPLILVTCASCGKKSRYNVSDRADGTQGYWLSKWGRGDGEDLVLVRRWIPRRYKNLSSLEIRLALEMYKSAV